jgi:drug/metabolite transporter (DMT)-like permease
MPAPPSTRHVLSVVAATACWGCGTVLSKQVLDRGVSPLTLLAIELAASCLILALATSALGFTPARSPALGRLAALGILNPGVAYSLGLLGLLTITASMSVLLWATEPIVILLLARVVLGERIGVRTTTAVAVALVGVVLVVHSPGASGAATGVALSLAAVTACALYSVLTRRMLFDDSSLTVVLAQQLAALACAVLATALAVAVYGVELGLPTDFTTWGLACLSGTVYYGFAFWLFVSGLKGVPAATAGSLLPLIPVFGLAAGHALGDRLDTRQWLGAAIVVAATAAVAAGQLRPGRAAIRHHLG